jgi:hypothetical protein
MLFLALALAAVSSGTTPVIDNARVRVWDLTSVTRSTALPSDPALDSVIVSLEPAAAAGHVVFRSGGSTHGPEAPVGTHVVVIELKDARVPPMKNASGYPNAFPRKDSKKIVDNGKVLVWDFSWTPGEPTRMHFHDKDVVVIYLETGDLKSTTPDNQAVVNHYPAGTIKFNPRDRTHTELLTAGRQRAIITELK